MRSRRTILAVTGLRVQRGRTQILRGVSWSVRAGQHWAILGANGSGKTSLLSALTGYLTPTAGEIEVLGERYGEADWRELRTHVGLVSSSVRQMMADEEPALDTVVSGKYAMIEFWGKASAADRRAGSRILELIECGYLSDRPWRVLSQGERQRVLIGRALMTRPRLLILDEPCAGLDPAAREHFLQFLARLARHSDAPALVMVTHHVEEIIPIFTHVLVLKSGRVLASGRTRAVLTSEVLAKAFQTELKLSSSRGRYWVKVKPRTRRWM